MTTLLKVVAALALVAIFWGWQATIIMWAWRQQGHDPKVMWKRVWKFYTQRDYRWWEEDE